MRMIERSKKSKQQEKDEQWGRKKREAKKIAGEERKGR